MSSGQLESLQKAPTSASRAAEGWDGLQALEANGDGVSLGPHCPQAFPLFSLPPALSHPSSSPSLPP